MWARPTGNLGPGRDRLRVNSLRVQVPQESDLRGVVDELVGVVEGHREHRRVRVRPGRRSEGLEPCRLVDGIEKVPPLAIAAQEVVDSVALICASNHGPRCSVLLDRDEAG